MKHLTRLFSVLALAFATVFLSACSDENEQNPQTIVDIAVSNSQFSTLVAALTKAELVSVLNGSGPFTVFAPTNDAFNELFAQLGVTGIDQLSKETLTPILLNHVISGQFKSTDLSTSYVSTVNTTGPGNRSIDVYIEVGGGVKINKDISVTTADILASNGVIHVINKVILPTDVVDIALNNNNFTSLVDALTQAEGDLVSVLKGDGPFTVFAPVNAAFDAISSEVASLSSSELADILKYHVVGGANVLSTDLTNGMTVNTLTGTLTVTISGSTVTLTDESGATATVVATDIQGKNGVIHVIDKVLLK